MKHFVSSFHCSQMCATPALTGKVCEWKLNHNLNRGGELMGRSSSTVHRREIYPTTKPTHQVQSTSISQTVIVQNTDYIHSQYFLIYKHLTKQIYFPELQAVLVIAHLALRYISPPSSVLNFIAYLCFHPTTHRPNMPLRNNVVMSSSAQLGAG